MTVGSAGRGPAVGDTASEVRLPSPSTGLPRSRGQLGLVLLFAGLPALTTLLVSIRDAHSLGTVLLLYLLAVVVIAVVGGVLPAVLAAIASFLLANWFLTPPYYTFEVEQRDSVVSLVVFVAVALIVSVTVDVGARRRVLNVRAQVEAEALARFTAEPISDASLTHALQQVRTIFGMTSAALIEKRDGQDEIVGSIGPVSIEGDAPAITVPLEHGLRLEASGPTLFAEDRHLLGRLAETAARAWEGQRLSEEASHARELLEIDKMRSALLAAVGHDLRTPLAGVKASVSSLRQQDVTWSEEQREELLATIEQSTDRLDELISNLLAMSRLQAGGLIVALEPVALDEAVGRVLLHAHDVVAVVDVPEDLPAVLADPGLLERVVANLIDNAWQFSRPNSAVEVVARAAAETRLSLAITDHGPGVDEAQWERMFAPFQRLDDRSTDGVGLGLAIAKGFTEAMHGTLTPSATPGGGLTMTVSLAACSPRPPIT